MKTKRKNRVLGLLCGLVAILLLSSGIAVVCAGVWMQGRFERHFSDDYLRLAKSGESPHFYVYHFTDRTNRAGEAHELACSSCRSDGEYIAYPDLPKHLINAFVSIEDKRFFSHGGVDWKRTALAAANSVLGFRGRFGASTITQQLVKNLTDERDIRISRKIQEVLYARDLESRLDKREILELYLNVIHFSDNCDGIGAAARHYFSKEASELTLAECATLAAITNNPSYYNPIKHPENNLQRRNLILSEMHAQGYIEASDYTEATAAPLTLSVDRRGEGEVRSWYLDMVLEDVINDLCIEYGMSRGMASCYVHGAGLRIDMAMDETIQQTVEDYYKNAVSLPRNEKGESAESALIVVDPHTGDVLGVAGAVGEKTADRVQNYATQTKRPPGSALKPLSVYAPALERGIINWASVYDDVPTDFTDGVRAWPKNATGVYRGLTNVSYAVAHSTNTVAVRILEQLGTEESYRFLTKQLHLSTLVRRSGANDCDIAALALGQLNYGVTLRELTDAYTVLADGGLYHPYRSYYRVLDSEGKVILSRPDASEAVLSRENAAIMTKLLEGVVEHGTSKSVTLGKIVECAGKTGTTNADCDRWFVGYTPDLICGVWCGFEYPEPMEGRNLSTGIWNRVMHSLVELTGGAGAVFDLPPDVVRVSYCRDSGLLPSDACAFDARGERSDVGYFVRGSEPTHHCECHVLCEYDVQNGGVSHGNCPTAETSPRALIRVPMREFPVQILVSDAQYVYYGSPEILPPNPNESEPYCGKDGIFHGVSAVTRPYHRSCTAHPKPIEHEDWAYLEPRFSEDDPE